MIQRFHKSAHPLRRPGPAPATKSTVPRAYLRSVAVVVTCHPPYLPYLSKCLQSVMSQRVDADVTVLVAFDGKATRQLGRIVSAAGIKWEHVRARQFGNVCKLRNWAASTVAPDAYLFVDADNTLQPGYLNSMVRTMRAEPRPAVVYPEINVIDETGQTVRGPVRRPHSYDQLAVKNYIESCSLVRASDFWAVGGFDPTVDGFMDWDLWTRLLRPDTGRVASPCMATLNYLRHPGAMNLRSRKNLWPQKVRTKNSRRAVFVPFSGREYCLTPMLRFLRGMRGPRSEMALYLYDNSPAGLHTVQDYAREAMADWGAVHYHRDTIQLCDVLPREARFDEFRGLPNSTLMAHAQGGKVRCAVARAMADRTTAIFNWAFEHVREELLLIVEDDTEPPVDVWPRLLASCTDRTPTVISGWYNDRFRRRPIVAREASHSPFLLAPLDKPTPGDGRPDVELVHATGFGAMLLHLPTLRLHGIRFRAWPDAPGGAVFGTDNAFGFDLVTAKLSQYVDWRVQCKHWQSETKYV